MIKKPANIMKATDQVLNEAQKLLSYGALVVFPTETVYGLGADATNEKAVKEIYQVKGRPSFNPLIVHVVDVNAAKKVAKFNDTALILAKKFWPGPITFILPLKKTANLAPSVTAGLNTVAVRSPNNKVALKLLALCKHPICAPSANKSQKISPTKAIHVHQSLQKDDLLILDNGKSKIGLESTILDCTKDNPVIVRQGAITLEQIKKVIPTVSELHVLNDKNPTAPGQLKRHYAPTLNTTINAKSAGKNDVLIAFGKLPLWAKNAKKVLNLSPTGDLTEAAKNLYATMHKADDAKKYTAIKIVAIPNKGVGKAINDKLVRSSYKG